MHLLRLAGLWTWLFAVLVQSERSIDLYDSDSGDGISAAASRRFAQVTVSDDVRLNDDDWTGIQSATSTSHASTGTMTLIIKHDGNPFRLSWILRKDGAEIDGRQEGFYSVPFRTSIHHIDVVVGAKYDFQIDAVDDFLGYYAIVAGKSNIFDFSEENLIIRKFGFVGDSDLVRFTARLPKSQTPVPTSPPAAPTPAPSSCEESIDWSVEIDAFKKNPVLSSTSTIFGSIETICSAHTSYTACTNEVRQDCQWIFLTQGNRKGKCRIDPIAKCLELGTCVCKTEDFHGGRSIGILFHAPISVTARDISPNAKKVTYSEAYKLPTVQNPKHPQDDTFFISRVDFTGRQLKYVFSGTNPVVTTSSRSIFFKLHYLYMDVAMVGTLWHGLGLKVTINTAFAKNHLIMINGKGYYLPKDLKKWTCTQIAITADTLYVAGTAIPRALGQETVPAPPSGSSLILGSFSGEMFDVRVYRGKASQNAVFEVGARCAGPNDYASIKKLEDIDFYFKHRSCSEINPKGWGNVPSGGVQTYGSSAFATLWMMPEEDPLTGEFVDVPEGNFDEEYFFQHAKLQSYQWERHYFENDMIAFIQEPYRNFTAKNLPSYTAKFFNNPCRYIHQNNNWWEFPLYEPGVVPKWNVQNHVEFFGGKIDDIFDLRTLYRSGGYIGYRFFTHEAFHEFQFTLVATYDAQPSGWLQESGAEISPAIIFPGSELIMAAVALAPAWPLSFPITDFNDGTDVLVSSNPHIFNPELSLNDRIRGGHYYGTWLLWWFLSEQAGLPHLLGQMFSIDKAYQSYWHGKLYTLRLLLRSHNIDLGDAYMIFVAHHRTWDFKNGSLLKQDEKTDLAALINDGTLPSNMTFGKRKTQATVNPTKGTEGAFVAGPRTFKPSPFSWNCLTASNVAANKVIAVSIVWNDGMGFHSSTNPPQIVEQHKGCDEDLRFYNAMVVLYNGKTGSRRYWKFKGKKPATQYLQTGNKGPVTMHILVMPTPPVDYSGGRIVDIDFPITPLPTYSYKYKVDILNSVPKGKKLSPAAPKRFGIVAFDNASATKWFSPKCSCLDDPNNPESGRLCQQPIFK